MPNPERRNLTLRNGETAPVALLGNTEILGRHKVAFLCSSRCAPDRILPAHDKARALRDAGIVVASGFQTPIEHDAFDILLRGTGPIIWCPARSIDTLAVRAPWRKPLDDGRLLVLSFCPNGAARITREQSRQRTRCLVQFADEIFIAHATPGGCLENFAFGKQLEVNQ